MKFYIGSGMKNYELVNYYAKVLQKNVLFLLGVLGNLSK